MKLFDLHCDTLTCITRKGTTLNHSGFQLSIDSALSVFEEFTQVLAVYSRNIKTDDENYRDFKTTLDYFESTYEKEDKFNYVYAVEGAKLLNNDIKRLDYLAERGVKILTLVWRDECCIGGGWNTDKGLTEFGKEVVNRCYDLGIIPDVSHSSDKMFYEIAEIAAKRNGTIMASHSCSRSVNEHGRNLTDDMAKTIASFDGVIGVNLVTEFLGGCEIADVVRHIDTLAHIAGEDRICLGCDLDGTDKLPNGISGVADLKLIYDYLLKSKHNISFADNIFYSNAQNFANKYLFR